MKPRVIRCEYCRTEILSETCKLAAFTTTIDGKEYNFCCVKCFERHEGKKEKRKHT